MLNLIIKKPNNVKLDKQRLNLLRNIKSKSSILGKVKPFPRQRLPLHVDVCSGNARPYTQRVPPPPLPIPRRVSTVFLIIPHSSASPFCDTYFLANFSFCTALVFCINHLLRPTVPTGDAEARKTFLRRSFNS